MAKFMAVVATLMGLTMTVSCGKRYVGYKVDHGSPIWCHYINGENHYTKDIGGLVFEFIIKAESFGKIRKTRIRMVEPRR